MSRELARTLLVSPPPRDPPPWDRWDAITAALGLAVATWLLAFKLIAFERLFYTSDAFELHDLATARPEVAEALRQQMAELIRAYGHRASQFGASDAAAPMPLDPERLRELEALGYVTQ